MFGDWALNLETETMMSMRKSVLAGLVAWSAMVAAPAQANVVFSTTFGGVTITFTYEDTTHFQLKLENVADANSVSPADWAGIQYLGAWSFNDIMATIGAGATATAAYSANNYSGTFQAGINANDPGCSTQGNPNNALCFDLDIPAGGQPGIAIPGNPNDTMTFDVVLTNATINDYTNATGSADFKIQWWKDDSCPANKPDCFPYKKVGSLYSQSIPLSSSGTSSGTSGSTSSGTSSGTSGQVPEPNSSVLALLGVAMLGSVMWMRRRANG